MKRKNRITRMAVITGFGLMFAVSTSIIAAPQVPLPPTADENLQEINRQAPGFGGMFYDDNGDLNVYLTNPNNKAAAGKAIQAVLGAKRLGPRDSKRFQGKPTLTPGDIKVIPAKFDVDQLAKWKQSGGNVFTIEEVSFIDLDEARNRITIGVTDTSATQSVEDILVSQGVPLEAVSIEKTEPAIPLVTVRDRFRPTKGGIQINFGGFLCTMGFNAYRSGIRGFVTNSHCTNIQGGVESTIYHQPVSWDYIGWEIADPTYFTSIWPWECPWFKRCRYSDSAFVRYTSTVSSSLGRIAQPTSWTGSITINNANPEFRIVRERPSNVVGDILDKVGRTTGWTYGKVVSTCGDYNVNGSDVHMKCQDKVQSFNSAVIVGGGDSGSSVFVWHGNDVDLSGILWGGNDTGTEFILSPLRSIESELGALTTF